jgi:hypothetical protein
MSAGGFETVWSKTIDGITQTRAAPSPSSRLKPLLQTLYISSAVNCGMLGNSLPIRAAVLPDCRGRNPRRTVRGQGPIICPYVNPKTSRGG